MGDAVQRDLDAELFELADAEKPMIIWKGWGFLVAVFVFGASLAMELITESIARNDNFYQQEPWPLALALALAGIITWFTGKALHARGGRTVIDKATGQELLIDASHTFFFIPMHYWGILLIALAPLPFVLQR